MKRFALGQNTVDVDRNAIQRKNETFRISTREMEVLDYLANNGRVVSRTELLENVWADVVVNSEVVTLTISRLRSVLGDDSRRPQIIETIPKKGYRLMVTPEVTATTAKPHRSVLRSGWFWVGTLTCLLLVMIALFSVVRTEYGKLESERGADVVVEEATK
jgi:DNA-binding winged helix-turn-helix (wHTH) protein